MHRSLCKSSCQHGLRRWDGEGKQIPNTKCSQQMHPKSSSQKSKVYVIQSYYIIIHFIIYTIIPNIKQFIYKSILGLCLWLILVHIVTVKISRAQTAQMRIFFIMVVCFRNTTYIDAYSLFLNYRCIDWNIVPIFTFWSTTCKIDVGGTVLRWWNNTLKTWGKGLITLLIYFWTIFP